MSIQVDTIQKIHSEINDLVQLQCEKRFKDWCLQMKTACLMHGSIPDGLIESVDLFCLEKKHLFFRGFKTQVENKMIQKIEQSILSEKISVKTKAVQKPLLIAPIQFDETKNRIFLEAFLMNKENARQTAAFLGVSKSTFHDWKHANMELIEAERRKSLT